MCFSRITVDMVSLLTDYELCCLKAASCNDFEVMELG